LEGTGYSDTAEELKGSRAAVRLIYQSLMLLIANCDSELLLQTKAELTTEIQ
jgi:hypothetical protein